MTLPPSYHEIGSMDAAKSSAFLAAVFEVPFIPMGANGGWFDGPALKVGLHGDDPAPQIYVYFAVDDLVLADANVCAAGGTAEEPVTCPVSSDHPFL